MKKLVICNFKQYELKQSIKDYLEGLKEQTNKVKIIIAPQAFNAHHFNIKGIEVASQDISKYETGPHTGEISVKALKDNNIKYCLVGHYEREEFGETEKDIINKINILIENNIHPILSIGETKEEYDNNKTLSVIESKIANIYNSLPYDLIDKIIISYEPKWMIGNKTNIHKEEIEKIINTIKAIVNSYYGITSKVIYGGGVDKEKIKIIKNIKSLDGVIIGSESTDIKSLNNIIDIYSTK